MVRSRAAVTIAAALLISACTGEAPSAGQLDEPYYSSAAALDAATGTVIRGEVTSVSDAGIGDGSALAEVTVLATAKGGPSLSAQVEFFPEGAGTPISSPLEAGQEYVLLLSSVGDHDGLVNSTQGWYLVQDGLAEAGPENRVLLPDDWAEALGVASH